MDDWIIGELNDAQNGHFTGFLKTNDREYVDCPNNTTVWGEGDPTDQPNSFKPNLNARLFCIEHVN